MWLKYKVIRKRCKSCRLPKIRISNLTHQGDDFCGIFTFYNTSIISAAILDVFQLFQALINLKLTDFEVDI